MIFLKPHGSHFQILQTALMYCPHFASVEGYADLEGGSDVRFCLADIAIFSNYRRYF